MKFEEVVEIRVSSKKEVSFVKFSWNYGSLESTKKELVENPSSKIIYLKYEDKKMGEALSIHDANALIENLKAMIESVNQLK